VIRVLALLVLAASVQASGAQTMPAQRDIDEQVRKIRKVLPTQLERAQRETGVRSTIRPDAVPPPQGPATNADPGAIASRLAAGRSESSEERREHPVLVFVSLSMQPESLKRLARDTARAGVPMVFRGLRYGVGPGAIPKGLAELKLFVELGANVLIDPDQFATYSVDVVPSFIVTQSAAGCSTDECAVGTAKLVGDVSLAYAMAQLTGRRDEVGRRAREVASRLPPP
jgi:type-F conjugative transfer system pilin assembly protein TrbC